MTKIRDKKAIKALGEKVKSLRLKAGMSQYMLADLANIERSQLIAIENGRINTTISTIYVIAFALNVEPYELLKK